MNTTMSEKRLLSGFLLVVVGVALVSPTGANAQTANTKGKISRTMYRVPYLNIMAFVTNDYITHGAAPSGNPGRMDLIGTGDGLYLLVAAADGVVVAVNDAGDDCGCHVNYGPCANGITILHANDELARYLHIQKNSAMVTVGQTVQQGDPIAIEGDVGFTCGNGRVPVADVCLASVPAGATNCGPHLHWDVRRQSTGEFVNPMICNIPGSLLVDSETYLGAACDTASACLGAYHPSNQTYDGYGTFQVNQSNQSITADNVTIRNFAGVVYRAQDRIRLLPGFNAGAGNAYFRGEIGPCNASATLP